MDIIETARQLGVAIQQDESFKRYIAAMQANDNSDQLQKLIGEFNLIRMQLDSELAKEEKDDSKVTEINNYGSKDICTISTNNGDIMKIDSYMPVRVFSGKNCLIEHSAELVKLGKRCLIVTGKHSAKLSGALDAVTDIFKSNNIDYCVFDKIEPNPFTKTCHAAGEAAREFECDYVQGYYFSKPLPQNEIMEFIEKGVQTK